MGLKKRKRENDSAANNFEEVVTSKPTAIYKPSEGRRYTLTVALPGSIIANAQTPELQIRLAGTIARALAVFCVDEVVIFDDGQKPSDREEFSEDRYTGYSDPDYFLAHILSYLECPPHLRKLLFAMHPDFRLAGTLPSLDMPHHLRRDDRCQYREGVTVSKSEAKPGQTFITTGLAQQVYIKDTVSASTRVTVKFPDFPDAPKGALKAEVVDPNAPREEAGYYWGYQVRSAKSLSAVLTESPFEEGYDLTFGTSERGIPVEDLTSSSTARKEVPDFNHMLIVLGGLAGLEVAVKADADLQKMDVKTPEALFDFWVNLVPGQGSRTVRTEEALWLALMGLKSVVKEKAIK